jgi:hypothetical protein
MSTNELTNWDTGDWPSEVTNAANFLRERDYTASEPAQLQILNPEWPDII